MAKQDARKLKAAAQKAVDKGKYKKAVEAYLELEQLEPRDGDWSRRLADCYRRLNDRDQEIVSLQRAVDRYAEAGFLVKAVAVCKRILQIDPEHTSTQLALAQLNRERGIPQVQPRPAAAQPPPRTRSIPPGATLDDVSLNQVMPEARALSDDAGEPSGLYEIPLELDEVEIVEAPSPGARAAQQAAASVLPKTPLFSELDGDSLTRLIDRVELVELPAGVPLFRQGDAADALYVIAHGAVGVIAEGPPRTQLGRLEEGAFFGEIGLLTRQSRRASVEALEDATLLRIHMDVFGDLVEAEPGVLKVLLRFLRDRLIDSLIKTNPLFEPFGSGDRALLASRFRFLELERNAVLVKQGARAEGLFVLLSGRAQVTREHEGQTRRLATLEPGDVCGEMSLLTQEPAIATVSAEAHGFAVMMPADAFREVIMTHPQVLAFVGDLADERRRRNQAIAGGDADYAEGHIDLL